jgi:hypothetical protein
MPQRLTKKSFRIKYLQAKCAEVAELADALRSGRSERKLVRVQIPPPAPEEDPVIAGSFCID